jgi:hypothetical protein
MFCGATLTMFWQELHGRDKLRADVAEGGVDATSELAHAGGGPKSDHSDNQCILDQVLTVLAAPQILELHIKLN